MLPKKCRFNWALIINWLTFGGDGELFDCGHSMCCFIHGLSPANHSLPPGKADQVDEFILFPPGHLYNVPILHHGLAPIPPEIFGDEGKIDQVGIVHTIEPVYTKHSLEILEQFGDHDRPSALEYDMRIIGMGFYPDDIPDLQQLDAITGRNGYAVILRLGVEEALPEQFEPFFGLSVRLLEKPLHSMAQFLQHHGLHQVIEGAYADRIDRIVIVGRDENDLEICFPDLFENFETAHPWHFDIQEDDIRPMMPDQQDGFLGLLGGRDHFQRTRKFLQFLPEILQAA
jgi:hypothetical protein